MNIGDAYFVSYPFAVQWKKRGQNNETKGKKAINQLLWGDWARIEDIQGNWVQIRSRRRSGWVRKENLQENRILEVNFVDVAQGDGAHIQTPDDKALVVDAGQEDNLYRFLRWRFGKFRSPFKFEAAVITHPDKDHYYGFTHLFEHENVQFGSVFHNGIVEQKVGGKNSLGKEERPVGVRRKHLTGFVRDREDLKKITNSNARTGGRFFPKMMKTAETSGRVDDISAVFASMDLASPAFLPGFSPDDQRGMTIKLLGPLPTKLPNGKLGLPTFGSTGKTKNGHSVVLQIEIGEVSIQLGGDLNEPSQDYLLEKYTGLSYPPHSAEEEEEMVSVARQYFQADVTKACHHGSLDISTTFLQAVNPLATVVSSGDNEPHAHPQPATLGLVGKYGRGSAPLIFSTELARSSDDTIKNPAVVRKELRKTLQENEAVLADITATAAKKKKAQENIDKALRVIERSVANYGMINLRTDGVNILMAQRLERDRSKSKRWDIHLLEPDQNGRLRYKKKRH
ncbi:ComEC family competence protein [Roseibium album]|nr:ComEC family competence protein [Roseibium album]